MGKWLETELKRLGASVEMRRVGSQILEGQEIQLPPVLLAQYGTNPTKKTVLVYGHYDVQPALFSDGWSTDPWTLTIDDSGRMFEEDQLMTRGQSCLGCGSLRLIKNSTWTFQST